MQLENRNEQQRVCHAPGSAVAQLQLSHREPVNHC